MELQRCRFTPDELQKYCDLFSACFPTAGKLGNRAYLEWLYIHNPIGAAVGFDAVEGERLAAHYVCIPMEVNVHGVTRRVLLSLNTATHPDFQGKGLFTKLAERTYEAGAAEGYSGVYGVANANSTPGFLRKLGFDLVAPLESKIGIGGLGNIDWRVIEFQSDFCAHWTTSSLKWRIANPANGLTCLARRDGSVGVIGRSNKPLIDAWSQIPPVAGFTQTLHAPHILPRVWLGLLPSAAGHISGFVELPDALRPSPLNLIYRSFVDVDKIAALNTAFSFLDFDAF